MDANGRESHDEDADSFKRLLPIRVYERSFAVSD